VAADRAGAPTGRTMLRWKTVTSVSTGPKDVLSWGRAQVILLQFEPPFLRRLRFIPLLKACALASAAHARVHEL
jgi:hypothetical protein